ncbi:hypothetical protein CVIRNUC_007619 [Coccomyxa viridis]|uniref:Uncharacterized protein n=1 Tax=Coccomyxa viridis TaxID=1274662 RepID=A0AAV1IEJ3_9CHLO|nr:hypothetical protein CVIRNUC_007619 [Coccomyxa viridis]
MAPGKTVYYNGIAFAPVAARMSMVISAPAEVVWDTVSKFGKQALWMGSVEGQHIFTELLGGQTVDYVGAVRAFGIADKLIFEQLTCLDHKKMVMSWQGISHPMNSNPFPASFLNFKGTFKLSRVYIPGNQTFMDWTIELLTEVHAVDYMQESMNGIMRVGMLNLQKYLAAGAHPSASLEMQIKPPEVYGIHKIPQPASAAMLLHQERRGQEHSGVANMMYAHQTYVPAPMQQSAPILSRDRIDMTANKLELTVPLLHEPHTAKEVLVGAYNTLGHQAASSNSMLHPVTHPFSQPVPSASAAQQQYSSQQLFAQRQRGAMPQHIQGGMGGSIASNPLPASSHSMNPFLSAATVSSAVQSMLQPAQLSRPSPRTMHGSGQSQSQTGPSSSQVQSGLPRVRSGSHLAEAAGNQGIGRNLSGERYPAPRAAQDIRDIGALDSLSISDVPRDRLRRSGNSGTFQQQQQQQQQQ